MRSIVMFVVVCLFVAATGQLYEIFHRKVTRQ